MTAKLSAKNRSRLATAKKYSGKYIINIVIYILLIEFAFVFLYPFIYMILNSLKYDYEVVDATKQWIITEVNWNNYVQAFKKLDYFASLRNTLIIVLTSTLGHIISCALTGYGLARFKFKGANLIFVLSLLSLMVPPSLMIIPLYGQYSSFGMMGTMWPIILPSFLGFGLKGGLYIFLFRQFFKSLPISYEEAAKIEGCSLLKVFTNIMLPLSRTTILVVFILSCVWHWNDSFEPSTYLTGSLAILTQKIGDVASSTPSVVSATGATINMAALAACMLVILPLIIIYFIFQKQFMEGIESTGLAN